MDMTEMMGTMPADKMMGMSMSMMQECIEACSAAEMAATMCADSDMGMDMAKCASMCNNMADVANTMMRMMMRPMGYDMMSMNAMMMATIAMGKACSAECMMHADMDEHCRMCAKACDAMVMACEKAMSSMKMA
ncbi:MAG: aldehyde dehydrogenase [Rhodoglobus sp.]